MASALSPVRQPFGAIDGARLRNLGNVKNVQNALSPASSGSKSLKRRHENPPELDAENIDPLLFSPSKKAKGNSFDTPQKPHFILQPSSARPSLSTRQILTPKKLCHKTASPKPLSFSAPAAPTAPAGRSPKSKRVGILSKRRTSGYGRVQPPSFGLKTHNSAPFSIDAALSGTVSSYKAPSPASKPATPGPLSLDEAVPTGWVFEIHEDTPEEELGNLVQHSTQTLDISDDESKAAKELDLRGKENIPPDTLAPHMIPLSRRDVMTDEPRTPLGDLDASEYYAEGCDANMYIIVDGELGAKAEKVVGGGEEKRETPTPCPSDVGTNQDVWRELLAKVEQSKAGQDELMVQTDAPLVEVWESESAKGDETPVEKGDVASSCSLEECYAEAEGREEAALAGGC